MSGQNKALTQRESSFIERLANQLGITAAARNIYGEPIEREGVTVIPVAKAAYAFGGGSGKEEKQEGSGGGGGVKLTPVGYIEIKRGVTRFRRTRDPLVYVSTMAAIAPLVLFALWGMPRLLGLKKPSRKTEK